ncbi:MAG: hypothetical protein ACK4N5_17595 [Myxococcales bacterium]
MSRHLRALAADESGQAMTESGLMLGALLLFGGSVITFAPDFLAAFTNYVQGFYVVLGYPFG